LRIDSHHSFSSRYPLDYLETILKRNRFEAGILVGEACWPPQDFVKGVVVRGNHFDPWLLDEYQKQPKFRGVCYEPREWQGMPDFFGELERRGIPLDVLAGLSLVPRIAERFPGLKMVIDHLGFPFSDDWAKLMEDAASSTNVYCKLSGLARIPSPACYVRHALAVFGPGRLMFGSDWPNTLPAASWKANLAAFTQAIGAQPMEIREELLGGTAARFYAL
jgi:L-fuconolactonase